jgi:adenine/guanine/hypoxanthine permease
MSLKKEFIGGVTTFLTMSYIIFVNPMILSTEGSGMSFSGVMTATIVLSASMTLLMGLYAKLPYAIAPGMGLNAFFTFSLILGEKIPWQTALGMVFWSGIIFIILSVSPLRQKIAQGLPHNIKVATAVGIGFLLIFIGLKNSGLIVPDQATFVRMGLINSPQVFTILGLLLSFFLIKKNNPFAFLATISLITCLFLVTGQTSYPKELTSMPDFTSVFFQLDFLGALKWSFIPPIISLIFTDLFDSISSFVGVARSANLLDKDGEPLRLKQALLVDAVATMSAGLLGTSSGTTFIESASGVQAGARTGKASVFTALCFLPCLFLAPLISIVPPHATAPVLICVGILMAKNIFDMNMQHFEEWAPALLTLILIPLSFSITKGLMWGLFIYWILFILLGRFKEIPAILWFLGAISSFYIFHN